MRYERRVSKSQHAVPGMDSLMGVFHWIRMCVRTRDIYFQLVTHASFPLEWRKVKQPVFRMNHERDLCRVRKSAEAVVKLAGAA